MSPTSGTAGVFAAAALAVFFMAGANLLHLTLIGGSALAAAFAFVSTNAYQMTRVETFLDPFRDPLGAGYNTLQGLMALAMGGITGLGLGASRQKYLYLPAPSTDFIFAIIGEEWGLVGTLAVVALFMVIAYQGYRIAIKAPDTFSGLLAAGITTWIIVQACINMMVVTALLPVTGIPLPFISYGGSALTLNLIAIGILLSISRETQTEGSLLHAVFDLGRRNRRARLPRAGRRQGPARRQPDAELTYIGGSRGFERRLVAGDALRKVMPYHELMVRSLRSAGRDIHLVLDPAPSGWLRAPGDAAAATPAARRAVHDRRLPGTSPGAWPRGCCASPRMVWEGNVVPGRATRAVGRMATRVAVSFPPTLDAFDERAFVSGTPIRSFAGVDRDTGARRVRRVARRADAAGLRRLAGGDPLRDGDPRLAGARSRRLARAAHHR